MRRSTRRNVHEGRAPAGFAKAGFENPALADDVKADGKFQFSPRGIGRIDGCLESKAERQTRAITERQAERTSLRQEIAGNPGVFGGEGHHFADRTESGFPSIIWGEPASYEFPVHFGEIDGAGNGGI